MRFAWFLLAIFAGRFFASALYFPSIDGDLAWQRWLGGRILATSSLPQRLGRETFTAAGAQWVPQEWLFSLAAFASAKHGWFALGAGCALCATLALTLCGWRAQRSGAAPAGIAIAIGLTGIALLQSFAVRVQVLAWPLLAAFLLLLETDGPAAYACIAVAAVWSNVHASVVLAPIFAAIYFLGMLLDRGWNLRARQYAIITVGCAFATCANPLGLKLPLYAVSLFSSPFKSMIVEWKPTDLGDSAFAYGALPLALCVLAFGLNGADRWRNRLLFGVVAWLMFSAARNVSVFALVVSPLAALALSAELPFSRPASGVRRAPRPARFRIAETFGAVCLAGFIGVMLVRAAASGDVTDTQPHRALAQIASLPGSRKVLCADFTWCSGLLGSRARVFLDGRADPYPQSVWSDYGTIVRVRPAWQATLRARAVDVVLVERTSSLEQALSLSPAWRSAYVDAKFRVWVRSGS